MTQLSYQSDMEQSSSTLNQGSSDEANTMTTTPPADNALALHHWFLDQTEADRGGKHIHLIIIPFPLTDID